MGGLFDCGLIEAALILQRRKEDLAVRVRVDRSLPDAIALVRDRDFYHFQKERALGRIFGDDICEPVELRRQELLHPITVNTGSRAALAALKRERRVGQELIIGDGGHQLFSIRLLPNPLGASLKFRRFTFTIQLSHQGGVIH